ncbi:MAG: glycoside hydrolase family 88 protein [Pirellulales bacterium]
MLVLAIGVSSWLSADEPQAPAPPAAADSPLLTPTAPDWRVTAYGVTRRSTPLICWYSPDDRVLVRDRVRILLVGGLQGDAVSVDAVREAVRWFGAQPASGPVRQRILLSAIPCGHPDSWNLGQGQGASDGRAATPADGYPPSGPAYLSETVPEAQYLWRWLGMFAPDLVIEVQSGSALQWQAPRGVAWPADLIAPLEALHTRLGAKRDSLPATGLVSALAEHSPAEAGRIPGLRCVVPTGKAEFLERLLEALSGVPPLPASPARRELQSRGARSARDVAQELAQHYGRALPQVEYIPALALWGRLRLAQQTDDTSVLPDLERLVEPYLNRSRDATPKSGSGQSGHLIFAALADCWTGEKRAACIDLLRRAAEPMFDAGGQTREVLPFHLEMSDAVFMGGPLLAATGRRTGESKYWDACVAHTRYMQRLDRRPDGLYRHSPLDETAWGRGNGFPALGLALILTDFPVDHPAREELVEAHRAHLQALLPYQDPLTGCWHQVIDHPESYRELTATCMITWALWRGIRLGWLDRETFAPAAERGWEAALQRIGRQGRLVDVCTGTGKQRRLRDYLDREALLGPDPRGGAMTLMLATERIDFTAPPR